MRDDPTPENAAYREAQRLAAASKNDAALLAFEEAFRQEPANYKAIFGVGLMFQRLNQALRRDHSCLSPSDLIAAMGLPRRIIPGRLASSG